MLQTVSILVCIVSVLLILIVLGQDSKGGGLASNFSAQNQIMGVKKTTEFVVKATWWLAGLLLILSFLSAYIISNNSADISGVAEEKIDESIQSSESYDAVDLPNMPVPEQGSTTGEGILQAPEQPSAPASTDEVPAE